MAEPVETPKTVPEELIEATPGVLLDHAPPLVAFVNVVEVPEQIVVVPLIDAGVAGTVITVSAVVA